MATVRSEVSRLLPGDRLSPGPGGRERVVAAVFGAANKPLCRVVQFADGTYSQAWSHKTLIMVERAEHAATPALTHQARVNCVTSRVESRCGYTGNLETNVRLIDCPRCLAAITAYGA